jgi:hypothetical protein
MMYCILSGLEAPYSGMSMNPARTFASALPAQVQSCKRVCLHAAHVRPPRVSFHGKVKVKRT